MPKIVATKETKDKIIKCYLEENVKCIDLAKRFNLDRRVVIYTLKKNGISIKQCQGRKFEIDHNYFNKINTEEKAYFLGLMYADGYNSETRNSIIIKLQEEDKEIIEKFKVALKSEKQLYFQKGIKRKNSWSLDVRSKQLSRDLKRLGCMQAKSLILRFPTKKQVPEHLLRHFIRGYFDGDGSFGRYKAKRCPFLVGQASICSTVYFLEKIKKILHNMGIKCYIYKTKNKKTTTRRLGINGNNNMMMFISWLYSDCSIYLKRKYDRYIRIKMSIENEKNI